MKRALGALLGASVLVLASTGALAQSVSNADFETGSGFMNLNHLTDWTKSGGPLSSPLGLLQGPATNWYAGFFGNGTSSLSQTVSGLSNGSVYRVIFDLAGLSIGAASGSFTASLGDNSLTALIGDVTSSFQTFSFTFTANGNDTLAFSADTDLVLNRRRQKVKASEFSLDNVRFEEVRVNVPGPVAGAGLPFLIAGAGLWMRRRNARA